MLIITVVRKLKPFLTWLMTKHFVWGVQVWVIELSGLEGHSMAWVVSDQSLWAKTTKEPRRL